MLRAEIDESGYATRHANLRLILAFHHAVANRNDLVEGDIRDLRELTDGGDYAYYVDLAHYMAALPLPAGDASAARWLDGPDSVRTRWRDLVQARQQLR
ncbi:hypothetical protein [Streptacidiphilus neutrinimicus]|uniref:hypothetical protein n=1 Tax=Streptacidiphilus neutrinimicus TaxID=105420 RepID=UPI0005AABB3D|nr:hypothetical protein [Streptacidiphilus neutrinimicus]